MTDLIREIEQESQRDRVQEFIKNNILGIIGGVVFAVLVAAGYLWWQGAQERRALSDSATFGRALQAFQAGNLEIGLTELAELETTSNGYAVLARLEAAKRLSDVGQIDAAIVHWDAVIADDQVASPYRELVKVYKSTALASAKRYAEALSAAQSIDKNSVGFAPKSLELQGLIHWQRGDTVQALATFEEAKALMDSEPFVSVSRRSVSLRELDFYIEQLEALQ